MYDSYLRFSLTKNAVPTFTVGISIVGLTYISKQTTSSSDIRGIEMAVLAVSIPNRIGGIFRLGYDLNHV